MNERVEKEREGENGKVEEKNQGGEMKEVAVEEMRGEAERKFKNLLLFF